MDKTSVDSKESGADKNPGFSNEKLSLVALHASQENQQSAGKIDPIQLLEDLEKSESGMFMRDLVSRAANPPDPKSCDTRAQSPLLTDLQTTCNLDVDKIYKQVQPSTFKILNQNLDAVGSGEYACSTDGKACAVVTDYHVSKLGTTFFLQNQDQLLVGKASPVHSAANDLALIEPLFPEIGATAIQPITFGAPPAKSDSLLSVCYPTSKLAIPAVTAGKVLDPNGQVHVNDGMPGLSPKSIVTDQSIYGGCSGGPDFNKDGQYVGVTRATGSEGTVVVKAEHVRELLDRYEAEQKH